MSTADNKRIVRRIYATKLDQNPEQQLKVAREKFFAPSCVFHGPTGDGNLDSFFAGLAETAKGFPDVTFTIDDLIAEGNKVVERSTVRGTHQGMFRGIPATGKKVTASGIMIRRFARGKVVEMWGWPADLAEQIGTASFGRLKRR